HVPETGVGCENVSERWPLGVAQTATSDGNFRQVDQAVCGFQIAEVQQGVGRSAPATSSDKRATLEGGFVGCVEKHLHVVAVVGLRELRVGVLDDQSVATEVDARLTTGRQSLQCVGDCTSGVLPGAVLGASGY